MQKKKLVLHLRHDCCWEPVPQNSRRHVCQKKLGQGRGVCVNCQRILLSAIKTKWHYEYLPTSGCWQKDDEQKSQKKLKEGNCYDDVMGGYRNVLMVPRKMIVTGSKIIASSKKKDLGINAGMSKLKKNTLQWRAFVCHFRIVSDVNVTLVKTTHSLKQ